MLRHSILAVALIATFVAVVPAQVLLNESFNNNAAGWTLGPQWGIGAATASTTCDTAEGLGQDPGVDADGKVGGGVAGVVIGGCTGQAIHFYYYLESPVIDATGSTNLRLEFDRWLNSDYMPFVQSTVDVWNGSTWTNIFATGTGVTTASSWSHHAYNISSLASPRLKVRFGYASFDTAYNHAGWNIDNVRITNGESFFDRFRNNAAGWTLGTEWAIGNATAGGHFTGCSGSGDPGSDADGTAGGGVAGVVLGGNATTAGHGYYFLTSPVINTTGSTALELQFDRWLNADYQPYMDSNIQVFNGATWQTVFATNNGQCTVDGAWNTRKYDIQAHSNGALQVRFGITVLDPGNVYSVSSWNIDNLSIHDNGGACVLQYSAYNGPGSVRFSSHCLSASTPPGTLFFQCFTTQGSGPFWFFGINPSLQYEVLSQFQSNALPFVGYSNAQGDLVWDVPTGIPSGLGPFYGVMVAINPSGQVVNFTAPISFVTL